MDNGTAPAALVTGAASGLGRACAQRLRRDGHRVVGLDLDASGIADDSASGIADDIGLVCDVSDPEAVAAAVTEALDRCGRLDVVAHCAGTFPAVAVPVHKVPHEVWQRTIDVNLTGAFNVAQAVLPALMRSRGALVMVASVAGDHPQPGGAVYAASKAAVAALVRALAIEYAPRGVRVNSVSPGWMDTAMAAPVLGRPDLRARAEERSPLRRVAQPEEVAAAVAWLLSDQAGYVTGHDLVIDGGMSLTAYVDDGEIARTWKRVEA